jgi:hypothetical protein
VLAKIDGTDYNTQWVAAGSPTYPLRGPSDLVSAPDYSFSASTGTGMYSPATNSVGLTANSTAILTAISTLVTLPVAVSMSSTLAVTSTSALTGNVGVGAASNASYALYVSPNITLTGTTQYGLFATPIFGSTATTLGAAIAAQDQTPNTAFTQVESSSFLAVTPSYGAASSITNSYGLHVQNQGHTRATNANGIRIDAQSGSGTTNIGLYNLGTSRFDGGIGVGTAPVTNTGLQITSANLLTSSQAGLWSSAIFSSAATAGAFCIAAAFQTAAAAFTMVSGYTLYADVPVLGASSVVTNIYGLYVQNQGGAGRTNAYGVYIAAQSGASTANVGLYNAGSTKLLGTVELGTWFNGNGTVATCPPAKGTGAGGPVDTSGDGWIPFNLGGTTVYVPYWA